MALKTVKVHLPEELLAHLGENSREVEEHVAQAVLLHLVAAGRITASYAAEILGMDYRTMLRLMEQYQIPTINYDADEVEREVEFLREHTA